MTLRALLILPPVLLAGAGLIWMQQTRPAPPPPRAEMAVAVRVSTIEAGPVAPVATGYGLVTAAQEWTAVSEVQGRIAYLYPGLAEGTVVDAGEVLLRVDPTDYDLARARAEAGVASAQASLRELDQQVTNTRQSLDLQERILAVAQAEFDRVQALVGSGTGTQSSLNAAERTLLAQQTAVVTLRNTLALLPVQRAAAEAALATRQSDLAEARRALARTTIAAPLRGRVSMVTAEPAQFVRTGDRLLTLEGVDAVEIVAEIQPGAFVPVAQAALGPDFLPGAEIDTTRVIDYLTAAGVSALVRVERAGLDASYPAVLTRFRGRIDDATGTIGLAVRVEDPTMANRDRRQPPLSVGTFVAVDLSAPPQPGVIAIPRAALHPGDDGTPFVWLADENDRLAVAPVTTGMILGDRIEITAGLAPGDRLILSDPRPPVPGLRLIPVAEER